MSINLHHGECLEWMKSLPDKSVDLFLCDLPYGETNCGWDTLIDMTEFWKQFKRIRKSKASACIHFCSTRFGYSLIKSWEKGYRMDLVWHKRNKTGGLSSRYRPMRNHEMVYFFSEKSPKYNRDKYHKRKQIFNYETKKYEDAVANFEGVSYQDKITEKHKNKEVLTEPGLFYKDEYHIKGGYEPTQPGSVIPLVEEADATNTKKKKKKLKKPNKKMDRTNFKQTPGFQNSELYGHLERSQDINAKPTLALYEPTNPGSVIDPCSNHVNQEKSIHGWDATNADAKCYAPHFDPPLPASIITDYDPHLNEDIDIYDIISEGEDDEPKTIFKSTKCFIGKRNHQTEKPIEILEWLLKYWTDEGDVVLDPTMGSGSTGVACKRLGREFYGCEMTEKYYAVAEKRINETSRIIEI